MLLLQQEEKRGDIRGIALRNSLSSNCEVFRMGDEELVS